MKIKIFTLVILLVTLLSLPGCVYFNLNKTPTPVPTTTPSAIDASWVVPSTVPNQVIPTVPDFMGLVGCGHFRVGPQFVADAQPA